MMLITIIYAIFSCIIIYFVWKYWFWSAIIDWKESRLIRTKGKRAEGEIVDFAASTVDGTTYYNPIIEFKDDMGTSHRHQLSIGKPEKDKLGKIVVLNYLIDSDQKLRAKPISFDFFSLLKFVVGLMSIVGGVYYLMQLLKTL